MKLVLADSMEQVLEAALRRKPQPLKPTTVAGDPGERGPKGTVGRAQRNPFPGDQPTVVA